MRSFLTFATLCAACAGTGVPVATIAARPDDVASVDGIMRAFYEVVNVAPEEPRQWSRDRTLYSPWIRFVAIGRSGVQVVTHQQFVDESEPLVRAGFKEREIFRVTRRYGNIVHVDSTYETLAGIDKPRRSRGVNSIEIYFDGARWWIESAMWQSEDDEHPIPPELLPPPQ